MFINLKKYGHVIHNLMEHIFCLLKLKMISGLHKFFDIVMMLILIYVIVYIGLVFGYM